MNRLLVGLTLAGVAGCASLDRTSPGMMDGLDVVGGATPAESTVVVRVGGFSPLSLFTLCCGDVSYNPRTKDVMGGGLLFENRVETTDCHRTLQAIARAEGKELTNVTLVNATSIHDVVLEKNEVIASGVLRARAK